MTTAKLPAGTIYDSMLAAYNKALRAIAQGTSPIMGEFDGSQLVGFVQSGRFTYLGVNFRVDELGLTHVCGPVTAELKGSTTSTTVPDGHHVEANVVWADDATPITYDVWDAGYQDIGLVQRFAPGALPWWALANLIDTTSPMNDMSDQPGFGGIGGQAPPRDAPATPDQLHSDPAVTTSNGPMMAEAE